MYDAKNLWKQSGNRTLLYNVMAYKLGQIDKIVRKLFDIFMNNITILRLGVIV